MSYKIYQLGQHKLALGDCRDKELLKELIGEDKIDSIITDVPYGISYVENKKGFSKIACDIKIKNDNISNESDYERFMIDWIENIKPYLNDKNSMYIFNTDKMIFSLKKAMDKCDIKFSQLLVWVKNSAPIGRLDYLPQHEFIAYGWYKRHKFVKSKDKSIIFCPKSNKNSIHPTMKPPMLLRRLILNNTEVNDVIFDGFAGSGSLIIAAQHLKRKCIAIEIDEKYIEKIIQRYKKLTGVNALLIKNG